jgi:hypothetical protein
MPLYRLVDGGKIHFGGPSFGHYDLDNLGSLVFIMGIKGNPQFHIGGILVNSGDSIGGEQGHDKHPLLAICGGLKNIEEL